MMLFPGEVSFRKSKSAPAASRIYYLNFQGQRREFFWMQNKDDSTDAENFRAVNASLTGESGDGSGATAAEQQVDNLGIDAEQIAVLQALEPGEREQMVTMLGLADHPAFRNMGSASSPGGRETPDATATPSTAPPIRPSTTDATATPAVTFNSDMLASVMSGAVADSRPGADLADILSQEQLAPLLDNEAFVAALLPHLPEGEQTISGLRANVSSPQFSQALQVLNGALQSGDLAGAMSQFGVDPAAVAAAGGGALGLASAIAAQTQPTEEDQEEAATPMDKTADP